MEYKLYCIKHDGEKYQEISKRILNDKEKDQIKKACDNINTLKLLYEIPYSLKRNYDDFIKYVNTTPSKEENFLWNINKRIVEENRLIFNLVSSLNAIENYYKNILDNNDFNNLKTNYISLHYDKSFNYRFLYQLRNYVNHSFVPVTLAEFRYNKEIKYNKIFADKKTLLRDDIFKKKLKEEIEKKLPDNIDITKLIMEEIPAYIQVILNFINQYKQKNEKDIDLIKEYQRKLDQKTKIKIDDNNLIYGIETSEKLGSLNIILPIDFIKAFEKNQLYADFFGE